MEDLMSSFDDTLELCRDSPVARARSQGARKRSRSGGRVLDRVEEWVEDQHARVEQVVEVEEARVEVVREKRRRSQSLGANKGGGLGAREGEGLGARASLGPRTRSQTSQVSWGVVIPQIYISIIKPGKRVISKVIYYQKDFETSTNP